jgi:hypothetical protein
VIYKKEMKQKQVLFSGRKRPENFYAIATEKYDPHLQGSHYLMDDPKDPTVTTEF